MFVCVCLQICSRIFVNSQTIPQKWMIGHPLEVVEARKSAERGRGVAPVRSLEEIHAGKARFELKAHGFSGELKPLLETCSQWAKPIYSWKATLLNLHRSCGSTVAGPSDKTFEATLQKESAAREAPWRHRWSRLVKRSGTGHVSFFFWGVLCNHKVGSYKQNWILRCEWWFFRLIPYNKVQQLQSGHGPTKNLLI